MKKKEASKESVPRKRQLRLWIMIAAIAVVLVAIALLIRWAGDQLFTPTYDASQSTASKFAKISRWIPPSAELDIAIDVQKALQDPWLRDRLTAIAGERQGMAAELVAALLEKQSIVGMLLLVGTTGEIGSSEGPSGAVIVQGGFNEAAFIPAVRAILASGKAGLSAETVGGRTLYAESDVRAPFGFIVLDGQHIAVGDRDSLVALFREGPTKRAPVTIPENVVLFGHMSFGPRIHALLPPGLSSLSGIEFASTDGKKIVARIAAGNPTQVNGMRMFLEGIRSLLLLQEEGNPALAGILKGLTVDEIGGQLALTCDVEPLLELWSSAPTGDVSLPRISQ